VYAQLRRLHDARGREETTAVKPQPADDVHTRHMIADMKGSWETERTVLCARLASKDAAVESLRAKNTQLIITISSCDVCRTRVKDALNLCHSPG
jgi:hypothetical protein